MSNWVRLWEDMPDDPKWRVVAKRSGLPLHMVIAVFTRMLVNAGRSSVRGELEGWNDEDEAMALDMEELEVACIRNAMQSKVLEGNTLTGWDKRQPKREDNSTSRVAAFRERQNASKRDETQCNAPEEKREEAEEIKGTDASASVVDGEPPTIDLKFERDRKRLAEDRAKLRLLGEQWNAVAAEFGLPAIEEIQAGSPREKSALARIREGRDFDRVFAKIRGSPFLRGDKGSTPAAFDWIMNPRNFLKIVEGNYDEIRPAKPNLFASPRH